MEIEKFLSEKPERQDKAKKTKTDENLEKPEKIGQNQFYDIITSKKPDWQAIIYELIHTEQLDPWDIDIVVLTKKFFERILEMEEADYYISSKVLFAAALLLRIKSEFLLNRHLRSIDEILFGKKDESKPEIEKIEIDEDELPLLIPKTPLPRARRVTLPELMSALNKAINTEGRRIKREVMLKRAHKLSHVDIPKFKRIDLKDRIKQFYARILTALKRRAKSPEKHMNKIGYSELIGKEKEERIASFLPLLHLGNTKKLFFEQKEHLDEIWIFLYEYFKQHKDNFIEELEKELEDVGEDFGRSESVDSEGKIAGLEKARLKKQAKKKMQEAVKKELEKELGTELGDKISDELEKEVEDLEKKEKIDKVTGFEDEEF
jgi:segregation and condensation protein A